MSFWSDPELQPKRQFRWLMEINGIPSWIVKKVNKPSFEISEATHKYLNHTFYYPGGIEYQKSEITLVDPLSPDATALILQILTDSGYRIPVTDEVTNTLSKASAVRALGEVRISQLDAGGAEVDAFTFVNAWISSAKFGDLDYEGDGLIDLTMSIRYDFVTMATHGSIDGILTGPVAGAPTATATTGTDNTVFDDI